eukprot:2083705-Pleurochrysis_carterae.AAC.1
MRQALERGRARGDRVDSARSSVDTAACASMREHACAVGCAHGEVDEDVGGADGDVEGVEAEGAAEAH